MVLEFNPDIKTPITKITIHLSAWPEVRGTADTDGGAYSPFRSILLVLTHDLIIIQVYGPTGGDGSDGWRRGRWNAHHFRYRLRRRGCCMLRATSSQLTVPPHELPPARLVIHRQTSVHERRKGTLSVQSRWVATPLYAKFWARNH